MSAALSVRDWTLIAAAVVAVVSAVVAVACCAIASRAVVGRRDDGDGCAPFEWLTGDDR